MPVGEHTADLNVARGGLWDPEGGDFTETLGPSKEGVGAAPGTVLKPFFLFCSKSHEKASEREPGNPGHRGESLASSGQKHQVAKWTSPPVGLTAPGSPTTSTESTPPPSLLSSSPPHFVPGAAFHLVEAPALSPFPLLLHRRQSGFSD